MNAAVIDSLECLDAFVAAFENHTLPKSAWTHAAHVTVAASYLYRSDAATVLPTMRANICGFNESVGTENTAAAGYHETLTVFWLRIVDRLLDASKPTSRLHAAQLAVAAFGERRKLHTEYYASDIVAHTHARREWVEPDLQPL